MPEAQSEGELLYKRGRTHSPQRSTSMWPHVKRIDGPWSWIMCSLLLSSILVQYGCVATYGILFPNILKEFQTGRAITGESKFVFLTGTVYPVLSLYLQARCKKHRTETSQCELLDCNAALNASGIPSKVFLHHKKDNEVELD